MLADSIHKTARTLSIAALSIAALLFSIGSSQRYQSVYFGSDSSDAYVVVIDQWTGQVCLSTILAKDRIRRCTK